MKIQIFEGGLNTRLSPQLIGQNEAVVYENIDNEQGILAPVVSKTDSGLRTKRFATYHEASDTWVSSETYQDSVEFQKVLYLSDGANKPQKYSGTVLQNLGIDAPTLVPIVTANTSVDAPTDADLLPGMAGDLPSTTHYYILANDDGTFLSAPLSLSIDLTNNRFTELQDSLLREEERLGPTFLNASSLANRRVTIQNVKGLVYGANGVNVYRSYGGEYYLVGNLTNDADTLADTVYDISGNARYADASFAPISGTIQYLYTFVNSVDGTESVPSPISAEQEILSKVVLTDLQVSSDPQVDRKRIYRLGGLLTVFTLVEEIPNTDITYTDELKDTEVQGTVLSALNNNQAPTGLAHITEAYAMLFGAEGPKLRFTAIGTPNYWSEFFFLNFSSDITGIAPVTNGLLVFTKFKTYIVTGTGPTTLSQAILDANQGCIDSSSIQFIRNAAVWASSDGICSSNGSVINVVSKPKMGKLSLSPVDSTVHDQVYYLQEADGAILALDFRYNSILKRLSLGTDALAVADDVLYGHKDGIQYSLFTASTVETLKYTSPRFVEGTKTKEKYYKKVYIYSEGDIIVKIYINNLIVCTKALSGTQNHQMQVPNDKQRGHFIHFEFEGTGTVHEYEYKVGRSKNDD